ncbi:ABC-2 type transporter [Caulifigura coniformis]|uniref:ABC-2 type transporter n=1 Tax=Caulifigura coniformis TaxID=2527983 RepID=A0A517SK73_9PLAN|nr:ABC-2 family transporter protein [Caulifigura coniformis]QDT56511.1 ABC-2 type transporter [Caulifigura coniformis]
MSTASLASTSPRSEFAARLRVHWVILRTCIEERLVYRGDFMLGTLLRFLPIVTQIFLWGAIFGVGTDAVRKEIQGFSYGDMVAYYLLTMVARAFSSMPGLASGIAREVRDGTMKKYLTQPVDMLGYLFWHRVAHKLVYYAVAIFPFTLVFWLCRSYFPGWPDAFTIGVFIVSLAMSFLIGFLLESLIGLIAFWFMEVNSLLFIYMMFNYFLSGHMLPLDMFPSWLLAIVKFLPFKYLAYFPATVMLGRYSHAELVNELIVQSAWVLGLFALNRLAYNRGVNRYAAHGG